VFYHVLPTWSDFDLCQSQGCHSCPPFGNSGIGHLRPKPRCSDAQGRQQPMTPPYSRTDVHRCHWHCHRKIKLYINK
jgi:hypothetical protein